MPGGEEGGAGNTHAVQGRRGGCRFLVLWEPKEEHRGASGNSVFSAPAEKATGPKESVSSWCQRPLPAGRRVALRGPLCGGEDWATWRVERGGGQHPVRVQGHAGR